MIAHQIRLVSAYRKNGVIRTPVQPMWQYVCGVGVCEYMILLNTSGQSRRMRQAHVARCHPDLLTELAEEILRGA